MSLETTVRRTVPFQRPEPPATDAILAYYALSEQSGWYANRGPCVQLLAERIGARLGGEVAALPLASGTLALMVALRATLGLPDARRRRVVVPSFTCPAVACAVLWAGFEPLFADVEPGSWQLDPASVSAALAREGDAVAGILGCSTFGTAPSPATLAGWRSLAQVAGVPLLIDSAAGFGSVDDAGRPLGSGPEPEIFSFHATKPLPVGEGGLLVAGDPELVERARRLANFGIAEGHVVGAAPGLNAKMSELHAATALALLDRMDDTIARRRAVAERLRQELEPYPLRFQDGSVGSTRQALHALAPDRRARDSLVETARAEGVEVRTLWDPPLHRHPAFAACPRAGDLAGTETLASRSLSLPLSTRMDADEIERVARVVDLALGGG